MAQYTTNSHLYKWEKTDTKQDTWTEFNTSMDAIDVSLAQKAQQAETNSQWLNVKYTPASTGLTALKGDGTDETISFQAIFNYAKNHLPITLYFPNGTYGFTDLGSNIAYSGLSIVGATDRGVVWKCLNTATSHTAINFDAFHDNLNVGFVQKCNVKNIIFEGNSETETIVNIQGIARSKWKNVYARVGKADTTSRGFDLNGVMLCYFENIFCSTQLDSMSSIPYYGLYVDEGFRQGATVGHSSNNTFVNCYFEGLTRGIYLYKGDQNTFISGSAESCSNTGLLITATSLYNTFIGTGFENTGALTDIDDTGLSTQYINCYSNNYVKLRGRAEKISGGLYNNVEVMPTAVQCVVENITTRHWGGTVGFSNDAGATGTKWKGIYDEVAASFKYPMAARVGITVGASPFTWTNTTGNPVQVFFGSTGTISSIQSIRNGGDPFTISSTIPAMYVIPPNDGLTVTYSVAPAMSYREMNGF